MRKLSYRQKLILSIILLFLIGILTKLYSGPGEMLVNNKIAGAIYVIFWSFVFIFFFPDKNKNTILLIVLTVTIIIEFSQIIQTEFLLNIRKHMLIHALIGSSFNLIDIPFYILGTLISFLGIQGLDKSDK